jgi:hypothetical protein
MFIKASYRQITFPRIHYIVGIIVIQYTIRIYSSYVQAGKSNRKLGPYS